MGFLANLFCKDTLEKNALLVKDNQTLLHENNELKNSNAALSSHVSQIDTYNKTEEQYRTATTKIKQKLENENDAFQKQTSDYEDSRKRMGDDIVRLKTKIEERNEELKTLTETIIKYNATIEENKAEICKLAETISELTTQSKAINDSITVSKETEAKCKKEERNLISALEILDKQQSQAELNIQAITESLEQLKTEHNNEFVFDLLEMDCKAGYVSEWAPQLFKRLYRYNKDRAKRLFLELWSRHPEPEKFVFSVDSLKLTVDGKPIEELFAAIVAERTGQSKENPEPFIRAWENFVNASSN